MEIFKEYIQTKRPRKDKLLPIIVIFSISKGSKSISFSLIFSISRFVVMPPFSLLVLIFYIFSF